MLSVLSYNDVFNELQNYILNNENIQKSLTMKICKLNLKNDKTTNLKSIVKKPDLFIPNDQDTLFWCFYIMKNGEINYETLNNKNSLVAKQIKIDLISKIRKHKDILKIYKFDSKSNIENNLAYDNTINTKTFLSLCAIDNINIIYIRKKTYYELLMNNTNIVYIVHELSIDSKYYNKYGFELATEDSINKIRSSLYKLDSIDKPIKGASSYKVTDLVEICCKLAIETINKETGKKKSKKDLYESIIQYF